MPCSEETPAVSPSKRARPAEEGVMQLRFARLSEHATAPTRGSARAAGYDLYRATVIARMAAFAVWTFEEFRSLARSISTGCSQ
ncbi:hypothetical protein P7K49_017533 [Saguinus oedipus]|uniref:Uncharacterized protein n=1 Tax=Saguinus oedipus TaxID=9490 RepID=A0ABQ9V367_SAGOE|nr:hypothetical protein P7K49_017533 [Saguinus oedipus]